MTHATYWINRRTHLTGAAVPAPMEPDGESGVELSLVGSVSAGQPIDASEEQEQIRVPPQMARHNSYALRVRGHSMVEDQIADGDIIIVEQRQSAENGEIVVALIHGEQVTLKRFFVEANSIRLQPATTDMAPIHVPPEAIQILGVVTGLVRMGD